MKSKYIKSDFVKNSLTMIIGTALAQLVPVFMQPILRRLYTPEEFGVYSLFVAVVAILLSVSSFRYENAIVIPEKDEQARDVLGLSIFISALFSIVLFFIFLFFSDTIFTWFDFPLALKPWIYLAPLSVFLFSVYRALNFWLVRKKSFKNASLLKLVRRGTEAGGQFSLFYLMKTGGLVIGQLAGEFVFAVIAIKVSHKKGLTFSGLTFQSLKKQAGRFKEFAVYSTFPALFNAISLTFPVIIVNKLFSEETTGFFDLSRTILALPLALVSMAISQVLVQKIAENKNKLLPIKSIINNLALLLTGLAVIGVVVFYFFSEPLFTFIFGDEWLTSGTMSKILVFSYAIKFVVSPLSSVFIALEKIKLNSIWQTVYSFAICTLYFLDNVSVSKFLMYYITIDLIAYGVYFLLIKFEVRNYERQLV